MPRIDEPTDKPFKAPSKAELEVLEARMSRYDGDVLPAELSDGDPGWEYVLAGANGGDKLPHITGVQTDGERVYVWAGTAYDLNEYLSRGYEVEEHGQRVRLLAGVSKTKGPIRTKELTCVSTSVDNWRRIKAFERAQKRTAEKIQEEQAPVKVSISMPAEASAQ